MSTSPDYLIKFEKYLFSIPYLISLEKTSPTTLLGQSLKIFYDSFTTNLERINTQLNLIIKNLKKPNVESNVESNIFLIVQDINAKIYVIDYINDGVYTEEIIDNIIQNIIIFINNFQEINKEIDINSLKEYYTKLGKNPLAQEFNIFIKKYQEIINYKELYKSSKEDNNSTLINEYKTKIQEHKKVEETKTKKYFQKLINFFKEDSIKDIQNIKNIISSIFSEEGIKEPTINFNLRQLEPYVKNKDLYSFVNKDFLNVLYEQDIGKINFSYKRSDSLVYDFKEKYVINFINDKSDQIYYNILISHKNQSCILKIDFIGSYKIDDLEFSILIQEKVTPCEYSDKYEYIKLYKDIKECIEYLATYNKMMFNLNLDNIVFHDKNYKIIDILWLNNISNSIGIKNYSLFYSPLYYQYNINKCKEYNSSLIEYKTYSHDYIYNKSLLYLYENKIATKYYTYFSLLIIIIDILTIYKKKSFKQCYPNELRIKESSNLNRLVKNEPFLYELEEFEIIIKNFYNFSCEINNNKEIRYTKSIKGLPCLDYFNNAMEALIQKINKSIN